MADVVNQCFTNFRSIGFISWIATGCPATGPYVFAVFHIRLNMSHILIISVELPPSPPVHYFPCQPSPVKGGR